MVSYRNSTNLLPMCRKSDLGLALLSQFTILGELGDKATGRKIFQVLRDDIHPD